MKEINCLGDICPIPVLKAKEILKTMNKGDSLKLITDHSCVVQSILDHFDGKRASAASNEVINGVWEIIITKN